MTDFDNFGSNEFLLDNAHEIKAFSNTVNILTTSAISQLQRLPISLRRRAASHNVKRLPFRLRKNANIVAKKIVKKCRKYRRRHAKVEKVFIKRQQKGKWLLTHVWHAKRYKIESKWGWKIPMKPSLKCFRPRMKQMRNNCCIMDISYFSMLELSGKPMIDIIKICSNPEDCDWIFERLREGKEVASEIYDNRLCYPFGIMCPVRYMKEGDKLIATIHPSAEFKVTEMLKYLDICVDLCNSMGRIRLLGLESHKIIGNMSDMEILASSYGNGQLIQFNNIVAIRNSYFPDYNGGWDLLVPCDDVRNLWNRLITKFKCRSIGWEYYVRFMSLEVTSSAALDDCFPLLTTMPDSPVVQDEANTFAESHQAKWKRTPLHRRVHFLSKNTKYPYSCPWNTIVPSPVQWFVERDTKFVTRIVGRLINNEIQLSLSQFLSNTQFHYKFNSIVPVIVTSITKSIKSFATLFASFSSDSDNKDLIEWNGAIDQPPRPIIGYATTAEQCLFIGTGRGRGYISFDKVIRLHCSSGDDETSRYNFRHIWFKNPNCKQLRLAKLSVGS